ncbi:hypothetical protein CDAR_227221 [Caerostris darwini]|uniref:Uncharacterized protein n=1 Tax=Caerostris darwini TaxID=1538125 RepID=A0AAV4PAM3_9ARAC|nr:hypothetical protein CDAR_227221 [Caerostris darwini]
MRILQQGNLKCLGRDDTRVLRLMKEALFPVEYAYLHGTVGEAIQAVFLSHHIETPIMIQIRKDVK